MKKLMTQLGCLAFLGLFGGCAVSTKDIRDPLEEWNRGVQSFNDNLDKYAMKPVA